MQKQLLAILTPSVLVAILLMSIGANQRVQQSNIAEVSLGQNEALRVYTEFADGKNRGMYDSNTGDKGYPDEDYDATTAMVINWHRLPEENPELDARLRYRKVHPSESSWMTAEGESFEFWHRDEKVNRVLLRDLDPGSVYEFNVAENGEVFRFRTMPASLDERSVKIIMTADHQSPNWSNIAHQNARMAGLQKPDMFIVAGDFINDEGEVTSENADRWALYLDNLYSVEDGYFLYDKEIDDHLYENLIIPHLSVLGNHETGERHHLRWPSCVVTSRSEPGYPQYVAANWMELLFHWPYKSEGFYSEFRPDHPNMNPAMIQDGFGMGGFGKLSFSDYLMIIGLDNSQNWEGEPDIGLRDWEGNLITDRWPWFETHHSDVRQDLWLKNLLEPEDGPHAGEVYTHILPVWHRGLFGSVRTNMSLKNRSLLKYWLPVLHRNGVKLIKEGHDHSYTRTVPLGITTEQPANTYMETVYYEPRSWELTDNLPQSYLDEYFAINTIKNNETDEIVGWEFDGNYITHDKGGMVATGHGGWAASRRSPGDRGGGNAGLWFIDPEKGGEAYGGSASFHINTVHLTNNGLSVEVFHPSQLPDFENGTTPQPIHLFRYEFNDDSWQMFNAHSGVWGDYVNILSQQPDKVMLSSPSDLQTGLSVTPTFSWNPSSRADEYQVQVATDIAFSESETLVNTIMTSTDLTLDTPLEYGTLYHWRVRAQNNFGVSDWSSTNRFLTKVETSSSDFSDIPNEVVLEQSYPNPFNPSTVIRFGLPVQSDVILEVFNVAGQLVAQLLKETKSAGWHDVTFDATSLSSGVYLYRLRTDTQSRTQSFVLIR